MGITEATAHKYATCDLTAQMIKIMHDQHLHSFGKETVVCPPCPDCPKCMCPVPEEEHINA